MSFFYRLLQSSDRPAQVTYAVFLLYGFIAVSLIVYVVRLGAGVLFLQERYSPGFLTIDLVVIAIGYLAMSFVTWKIANGRNWARWLLVIGFGFLIFSSLFQMRAILAGDPIAAMLILGQLMVTALAGMLLFQKPSSKWFGATIDKEVVRDTAVRKKGRTGAEGKRKYGQTSALYVSVDHLSVDVLAMLILKPQVLVTFALSALVGIAVTVVVNLLILARLSETIIDGLPAIIMAGSLGAMICSISSFISLVVVLSISGKTNDTKTAVKVAWLGVLIGMIPGGLTAWFATLVMWGILL